MMKTTNPHPETIKIFDNRARDRSTRQAVFVVAATSSRRRGIAVPSIVASVVLVRPTLHGGTYFLHPCRNPVHGKKLLTAPALTNPYHNSTETNGRRRR
jgi:hypothetical protein